MKKENQNGKEKGKVVLPCNFSTDFVMSPKILAANPSMQGQPTGIQPKPGMAKSRSVGRTRLLGGSAVMGGGTRLTLTHADSIVRSSDGVARVQILQANVPLYGMACGGGSTIPSAENFAPFSSSCHEVWTQNESRLLAAADSVVAPKP